jgi:hypothetical protein
LWDKKHIQGFRLVTTQNIYPNGNKLSYPALMEEDYFIQKSMHISKIFIDFKVEINRITQNENSQEYVISHTHYFRVQKICHVKSQNILWIQQKIQIQNKCDFKQLKVI